MTFLPPDAAQIELEDAVNAKLAGEAAVIMYQVATPNEPRKYGVVYWHQSHRHVIVSENPFFDDDAMVKDVRAWVMRLAASRRRSGWTTDPKEAGAKPWLN